MASQEDLLVALARAYTLAEAGSGEDPELFEALTVAEALHAATGWKVIRLDGEGFTVNREPFSCPDESSTRFKEALSEAGITELRLQEPLGPGVLLYFLQRLNPMVAPEGLVGQIRFRGLEGVIGLSFHSGDRSPPGMAGSVDGLFREQEEAPVEAPEEGAAAWHGEGGVGEEDGAQGIELPPELRSLVESYFSSEGTEKIQLGEAIVAAAARLQEAREQGSVANLVEVLADGAGTGPGEPGAGELAGRLTTPAVASQLVGRLGSSRDEQERDRLIRVSRVLGRKMAEALADALGEARDRYRRRSYMDAMIALGEIAREMAEGMVEDPRWYVVRNGVALLGEIGGSGAVSHLTGTLANEDSRVRKETVLALSKLGGDDAAMLLLGLLDDSDAEVRARACSAVGLLKVEKALKPLMELLEKDSSEDIQVQCLQALGRIGDPGAVPLIERKALGRLFSRPSKDVRLAAYRALAGIGTPHAKALLLKATRDSDTDVRKLALGLME